MSARYRWRVTWAEPSMHDDRLFEIRTETGEASTRTGAWLAARRVNVSNHVRGVNDNLAPLPTTSVWKMPWKEMA